MGRSDNPRFTTTLGRYYFEHLQHCLDPESLSVSSNDANLSQKYEAQAQLFETQDWRNKLVGSFYDNVTRAYVGGEIGRGVLIREDWDKEFGGAPKALYQVFAFPDIYNRPESSFHEVKGSHVRSRLKLSNRQVRLYEGMVKAYPDHSLDYTVYRHEVGKIGSFHGFKDELKSLLSQSTLCALTLPFSIVHRLYSSTDDSLVYRYGGGPRFESGTEVRPGVFKQFFTGPGTSGAEGVIESLGLRPESYLVERMSSHPKLTLDGHRVRQYPILHISEREPVPIEFASSSQDIEDFIPF